MAALTVVDIAGNTYETDIFQGIKDVNPSTTQVLNFFERGNKFTTYGTYLSKLSPTNVLLWAQYIGRYNSKSQPVAIRVHTSTQNILTCFNNDFDENYKFGHFVITDPQGVKLFENTIGTNSSDVIISTCTLSGDVMTVTGQYRGFVNFDPGKSNLHKEWYTTTVYQNFTMTYDIVKKAILSL
jgi:phosphoheptose isomerase